MTPRSPLWSIRDENITTNPRFTAVNVKILRYPVATRRSAVPVPSSIAATPFRLSSNDSRSTADALPNHLLRRPIDSGIRGGIYARSNMGSGIRCGGCARSTSAGADRASSIANQINLQILRSRLAMTPSVPPNRRLCPPFERDCCAVCRVSGTAHKRLLPQSSRRLGRRSNTSVKRAPAARGMTADWIKLNRPVTFEA